MVKGLEPFAKHFAGFEDSYVIIGGTACDIWMQTLGLPFRATKDLDIVLVVENLHPGFVAKIWEFVSLAGYRIAERSTGERTLYRFHKPQNDAYPYMIELFARSPFDLPSCGMINCTPIPGGDAAASLSAILMDGNYYGVVMNARTRDNIFSLPVIPPSAVIPLKAKAWLDLTAREASGEQIDEKNIRKHRNDIFRLTATLVETAHAGLPSAVVRDLKKFLYSMDEADGSICLNISRSIGNDRFDMHIALDRLRKFYGLEFV